MKRIASLCSLVALLGYCQSGSAALVITEVASTSGAPAGVLAGFDWWELTNTGPGVASLNGDAWEDQPVSDDRGIFPLGVSIAAGESIIIHQGAGVAAQFRSDWGLPASVQVLEGDSFGGPNNFSGLSGGGDQVNLFDAATGGNLISGVAFGAATAGVSFEWSGTGASLGLSVNGENGAHTASNGRIGSPGSAVIPEPTSLVLASLLGLAGMAIRRR